MHRHLLVWLGGAALALPAAALPAGLDHELDAVTVTGTRLERDLADLPGAATVIEATREQAGQPGLQLDEPLKRVPGLYLQNRYNFAQGLRLSSRGFGARAPFGVRGLRLNVDGFPETLPDGQSQVDAIDLDGLESITVLRGPSSVLYGNATGGVVDMTTRTGRDLEYDQRFSVAGGSDGYRKTRLELGGADRQGHHYLSLTGMRHDGQRQQSDMEKYLLNARVGRALSRDRDLELFFTALDTPVAEDPGGLTRAQVNDDRDQAARFSKLLDAGQEVTQQRLGVLYRERGLGGELRVRGFVTQRDFRQQLPFPGSSLIDYERLFYGLRLEYTNQARLFGLNHRFMVGVDADRQRDDRGRRGVDVAGQVTGETANEDQTATASGLFVQADTDLTDTLVLALGARADRVRLDIDDHLLADGDQSGDQTFNEGSYSAGLTWHLNPRHSVYATVSNAFETPTFTELANPSGAGGFNPDLDPQKAVNREVGGRGRLGDRLFYDIALFSVRVRDEITPYELNGRTFYDNAARTRRDGLELMLEHQTTERLTLTLAYTYSDFEFDDFFDDQQNQDVSGNRLPGLPRHHLFVEAAWRGPDGTFLIIDGDYSGSVYADNTNDTKVDDSVVAGLRGGREWRLGGRALTLYAGVGNLFDEDYIANLRINANSDRPDPADRGYYEPAPGRHWYAGASYAW
ncbi:TonB-dependent receptor family protein [Alloalcanivorax sp. C16-2]|uniref:TonB-dependent receptor family protein n=1 Tax=Alloalcanivorax sp. C16-2 TaxID=3390052 RepID=UPI003970A325